MINKQPQTYLIKSNVVAVAFGVGNQRAVRGDHWEVGDLERLLFGQADGAQSNVMPENRKPGRIYHFPVHSDQKIRQRKFA